MIRQIEGADIEKILPIYNFHVENTIVTFDIEPLTINQFTEKINTISKDFPFLVFEENNELLGFAYASKWRKKPAYNKTVESTVYIKNSAHGKQVGSKLYFELLRILKNESYKIVIAGISLPNEASIKFHEKFHFKKVGHFTKVGAKFNKWIDVAFWQLDLH